MDVGSRSCLSTVSDTMFLYMQRWWLGLPGDSELMSAFQTEVYCLQYIPCF